MKITNLSKEDKKRVESILLDTFNKQKKLVNEFRYEKRKLVDKIVNSKKEIKILQKMSSGKNMSKEEFELLTMHLDIHFEISSNCRALNNLKFDLKRLENQYKMEKQRFVELDNLLFRINIEH